MERVVLKNTFLSLDFTEIEEIVPRRRAYSESPRRHHYFEAAVDTDPQVERLSKMLDHPRQKQSDDNASEMSKLPFASQLALSSLASMGLMALQQRLEEAGTVGCLESVPCAKARSAGHVASSDSASTTAPEDSDASEGRVVCRSSHPRGDASRAGPVHPRAKLSARSRREKTKAAAAQYPGGAVWVYQDGSPMCMDGASADWWLGVSKKSGIGCAWSSWHEQQAEAALAWTAAATTACW